MLICHQLMLKPEQGRTKLHIENIIYNPFYFRTSMRLFGQQPSIWEMHYPTIYIELTNDELLEINLYSFEP